MNLTFICGTTKHLFLHSCNGLDRPFSHGHNGSELDNFFIN
jgi:hypothetical protein